MHGKISCTGRGNVLSKFAANTMERRDYHMTVICYAAYAVPVHLW